MRIFNKEAEETIFYAGMSRNVANLDFDGKKSPLWGVIKCFDYALQYTVVLHQTVNRQDAKYISYISQEFLVPWDERIAGRRADNRCMKNAIGYSLTNDNLPRKENQSKPSVIPSEVLKALVNNRRQKKRRVATFIICAILSHRFRKSFIMHYAAWCVEKSRISIA